MTTTSSATIDPRTSITLHRARVEPARSPSDFVGGGGISAAAEEVPEWAHHLRNGEPVQQPEISDEEAEHLGGEHVWGGWFVDHPGHFVAEHAPRLLLAAREHPDAPVIILRKANVPVDAVPKWFWDVLSWLGIGAERVVFVTDAPVAVDSLVVFPQAEHLTQRFDEALSEDPDGTGTPHPAYLRALDDNYSGRHLEPWVQDKVYISRAGLDTRFGGEQYLERALLDCGVPVVRPESLSITDQMRLYDGAKQLIFAEGSALHFRQLIGARPQQITVLQRRRRRRLAIGQLRPRSSSLTYRPVMMGVVQGPSDPRNGLPQEWLGFPRTDQDLLLDALLRAGIDLRPVWDGSAFEEEVYSDLKAWASRVREAAEGTALRAAMNAETSLHALGETAAAGPTGRIIEPSRAYMHLLDVRPANLRVRQLTEANAALERELAAARREMEIAQADIRRLTSALDASSEEPEHMTETQRLLDAARTQIAAYESSRAYRLASRYGALARVLRRARRRITARRSR